MNKLSKKAKFAMIKSGAIKSNDNFIQSVWQIVSKNCETLNEAKSEISENIDKYTTIKNQFDKGQSVAWYLGNKFDKNNTSESYVKNCIVAYTSLANTLGYTLDKHFLITLN
jgi:hypothetical protein